MSDQRLKQIRKRWQNAVAMPWRVNKDESTGQYSSVLSVEGWAVVINVNDSDAQFIAHCSNDIPYLLNTIKYYQHAIMLGKALLAIIDHRDLLESSELQEFSDAMSWLEDGDE